MTMAVPCYPPDSHQSHNAVYIVGLRTPHTVHTMRLMHIWCTITISDTTTNYVTNY